MTPAAGWLEAEIASAPDSLRARIRSALDRSGGDRIDAALAQAAFECLRAAVADSRGHRTAIELLAADALLTHACAAAAEAGPEVLADFTTGLDAARFQQLLDAND